MGGVGSRLRPGQGRCGRHRSRAQDRPWPRMMSSSSPEGYRLATFDLVPQVLRQNHVNLLFERIAVKPGKPTVFGVSERGYCFGLPGNPVSTFVIFELLVKPFLYRLMGHDYRPPCIRMPLSEPITRKDTERQELDSGGRDERGRGQTRGVSRLGPHPGAVPGRGVDPHGRRRGHNRERNTRAGPADLNATGPRGS